MWFGLDGWFVVFWLLGSIVADFVLFLPLGLLLASGFSACDFGCVVWCLPFAVVGWLWMPVLVL